MLHGEVFFKVFYLTKVGVNTLINKNALLTKKKDKIITDYNH